MITVRYDKPKKLASIQSAFISFPFNRQVVDVLRSMPERVWLAKEKEWEIPFNLVSELEKRLPNHKFKFIGEPIDNSGYTDKKVSEVYTLPKELKTKLYDYQQEDYQILMNNNKCLLLWQPGLGKAQPLYSKLLTPNGYIDMGDVRIGDEVFGEDGMPHKVVGVYPQGKKSVYEITFSDGSKCRCSDEHLWEVHTKKTSYVLTLKEILQRGLCNKYYHKRDKRYYNDWKFKIPIVSPVVFPHKDVEIDPWLLGVLVGDGCLVYRTIQLTNPEVDIVDKVKKIVERDGMCFNKLKRSINYSITSVGGHSNKYIQYLDSLGLMGHKADTKFIPNIYKYNDIQARLAVLQGLFATDGYVFDNYLQYSTSSKQLAEDIVFLVQSLGGTCSCNEHETFYTYKGERKQGLNNFELVIKLPNDLDLIQTDKQKSQYTGTRHTSVYRKIRSIDYIGEDECQCIMVDNPSHLYLTDNMIVTHNTVATISVALKRRELGQINHCLIVCGVNTIKYTLAEEVKKHTGMNALVLGSRQNRQGMWNTQGTKEKLEDLEDLSEFFIITNVESLRNKDIKDKIKWHMDKGNIGMMVLDECHRFKSPSSQQGKATLLLSRHCPYVIAMTGTLLNNTPLDSYVPLRMVDGEKTNLSAFKTRYCEFGGYGGFCITGYKNTDELQLKIDKHSVRRLKKDVLSLPPKIYTDELLEMSRNQAKMYSDVLKLVLQDIDKVEVSPDPLSMLTRLRQVTADTSILSDTIHESVKLDRMVELVEEATEKVLVFSNWTSVTDRAVERLSAYNPAIITGKVKDRQSQIDKFMNDDSCKVCVCTVAAAGVGLTLTAATTCIFLDEPYTYANKEQAEDRCYRIGQNSTVNVITLMCKGTIDEWIHKIVIKKKVMGEAIVDHKYSVNNPEVIKYILTGEGDLENNA